MPILAPINQWTIAADRIEQLGPDLLAARSRLNLTVKDQARAIGISTISLGLATSRYGSPSRSTILACLRWLASVQK